MLHSLLISPKSGRMHGQVRNVKSSISQLKTDSSHLRPSPRQTSDSTRLKDLHVWEILARPPLTMASQTTSAQPGAGQPKLSDGTKTNGPSISPAMKRGINSYLANHFPDIPQSELDERNVRPVYRMFLNSAIASRLNVIPSLISQAIRTCLIFNDRPPKALHNKGNRTSKRFDGTQSNVPNNLPTQSPYLYQLDIPPIHSGEHGFNAIEQSKNAIQQKNWQQDGSPTTLFQFLYDGPPAPAYRSCLMPVRNSGQYLARFEITSSHQRNGGQSPRASDLPATGGLVQAAQSNPLPMASLHQSSYPLSRLQKDDGSSSQPSTIRHEYSDGQPPRVIYLPATSGLIQAAQSTPLPIASSHLSMEMASKFRIGTTPSSNSKIHTSTVHSSQPTGPTPPPSENDIQMKLHQPAVMSRPVSRAFPLSDIYSQRFIIMSPGDASRLYFPPAADIRRFPHLTQNTEFKKERDTSKYKHSTHTRPPLFESNTSIQRFSNLEKGAHASSSQPHFIRTPNTGPVPIFPAQRIISRNTTSSTGLITGPASRSAPYKPGRFTCGNPKQHGPRPFERFENHSIHHTAARLFSNQRTNPSTGNLQANSQHSDITSYTKEQSPDIPELFPASMPAVVLTHPTAKNGSNPSVPPAEADSLSIEPQSFGSSRTAQRAGHHDSGSTENTARAIANTATGASPTHGEIHSIANRVYDIIERRIDRELEWKGIQ